MKLQTCILFQILLLANSLSCRKDEPCLTCPPPYAQHIFLDTLIVDPTEVWFRVYTDDSSSAGTIGLYRDSGAILLKNIVGVDTTIIDSGLTPVSTHSYRAYRLQGGLRVDSTRVMMLRTMDTTSHNFTWQIDTLGDGASSSLRDVFIVNDTCVWAVGEIHVKDSSGNWDPNLYNVARWDGRRWTYSVGASVTINAVFAFSATDVWAGTSAPYHFDGTTWQGYNVTGLFNGYVTKIWGTSSSNVYMVGTNGAIMHFDGTSWERMDSGTDVDLLDVWGSPDGSVVWACGYYQSRYGTYLLRNDGSGWKIVYDGTAHEFEIHSDSLSGAYSSVYTPAKGRIIEASSAGVYFALGTTHGEGQRSSFTSTYFPGFPNRLRGNGSNDLLIAGYYDMIAHYNGITWRYFSEFSQQDQHLYSVDQKGDFTVAVGEIYDPINSKGLVFRGRR